MSSQQHDASSSDRGSWEELRAGSAGAFSVIFHRHADAVYNFAFRRTACWATAEDVTQATFLALWRRVGQGRTDALRGDSARSVLLAMAAHECANAVRSRRRRAALFWRVPPERDAADHADAVAEDVDSERRMRRIRTAVASLPSAQQEVVEMVWWAGCSLQDTADALGIPVGTVKSRLARARARLASSPGLVVTEEMA